MTLDQTASFRRRYLLNCLRGWHRPERVLQPLRNPENNHERTAAQRIRGTDAGTVGIGPAGRVLVLPPPQQEVVAAADPNCPAPLQLAGAGFRDRVCTVHIHVLLA